MELTSDILEAITGPSPAGRPSRRFPFGSRTSIVVTRDGAELAEHLVLLRESTSTEFSFIDDESRNVGEAFTVWFAGSKNRRIKMRCVVSRSESTTDVGTEFVVGARYEQILEKTGEWETPAPAEPAPPAVVAAPKAHSATPATEAAPPREHKNAPAGETHTVQEHHPRDPASGGKNQQILSKVLGKLADQEKAMRRLEEERNSAVAECQAMQIELAAMKQSLELLQAKCDADDAAIAELAKLMETETLNPASSEKTAVV